jgi:hypothetical protein
MRQAESRRRVAVFCLSEEQIAKSCAGISAARDEQAGTHPSLHLIAALPALHIAANYFDYARKRLDDVGAGQSTTKLIRHPTLVELDSDSDASVRDATSPAHAWHPHSLQKIPKAIDSDAKDLAQWRITN